MQSSSRDNTPGSKTFPSGPLPDTGKRTHFVAGGAYREADPEKPAMEGISPYLMVRLGRLLSKADAKYGDYRNWERGMPITRYVGGILRHTALYMLRDRSEDHPAAIAWNAMCIVHHEEIGAYDKETGRHWSFEELDDRPAWQPEHDLGRISGTLKVAGVTDAADAREELTGGLLTDERLGCTCKNIDGVLVGMPDPDCPYHRVIGAQ